MIEISERMPLVRTELPEDCHEAVFKLICKFGITKVLENMVKVICNLNTKNEDYMENLIQDIQITLINYKNRY